MIRSVLSLLAASLFVGFIAGPGCQVNGIGDPCIPDEEYQTTFAGFDVGEVNVESKSFQCRTRLCLANHFQGRASCPYGQDSSGAAPARISPTDPNANGCVVPGTTTPIDPTLMANPDGGDPVPITPVPTGGKTVKPQCVDRDRANAVYCSCRCADANGATDVGVFCTCPEGFACTQLVTSIGTSDTGLTGAYCIKNNTAYDPNNNCAETCDPTNAPCSN